MSFDEPWPRAKLDAIAATGALPMMTWEPMRAPAGVPADRAVTDGIACGQWDAVITRMAEGAAADGRRTLLRFAHEFNGSWYPWNVDAGASQTSYVEAWHHIHNLFERAGATRVEWVWAMQPPAPYPEPDPWWPGTRYVDWIGIDAYNAGSARAWGGWTEFAALTRRALDAAHRIAPSKPVMIAETASSALGGDRAAWIDNAGDVLADNPQIRAFVWFDLDKNADWNVDEDPAALAALARLAARGHAYELVGRSGAPARRTDP